MSSPYVKTRLPVAGLWVNVYKSSAADDVTAHLPVAVLFLIHGRGDNQEEDYMLSMVEGVFTRYNEGKASVNPKREIVVVTFDQRNHGTRLIDESRNAPRTALTYDIYGVFLGTARDVSFLIDFLPPYLYPNDERTIDQWFAAGMSLGGHATWSVLRHEPRITLGVPIVGCPDLLALYKLRAEQRQIPFAPPYMPSSFLALVQATDAASPIPPTSPNPFLNKRILVLSGGKDEMLPYDIGRPFVEGRLDVGEGEEGGGVKRVVVLPDAGHECTPEMVRLLAEFVWDEGVGPNAGL